MNYRIKKKKQKLLAMNASKWKDVKLSKKKAHANSIILRHSLWCCMIRRKDVYARYLHNCRSYGRIGAENARRMSASTMLDIMADKRKEVKKKLFSNESNCNEVKRNINSYQNFYGTYREIKPISIWW